MARKLIFELAISLFIVPVICFDMDIVEEYFSSKHLVAATIFACSATDYITLLKQSMENYRYVASGSTYLNGTLSFTDSMHYPYYKLGVYLDYTCDYGKQVLIESSQSYILNASYAWFIRINSTDELEDFEDLNFGLDSDVILAMDPGNDVSTVDLIDLYKINSTSYLIKTPAGSYNKETGLLMQLNGTMLQRRRDFKGFKFNSALVVLQLGTDELTDDYLNRFINHSVDPESDVLSRCGYIYGTYLKKIFNYTVNVHRTNSFGYPNREGPILHDGMIGEIESKQIDFGMTPATMHIRTRMEVVHFTLIPLWRFRMAFMFCHPSTTGTYKALIIPFSTEVWVFVVCITLGFGLFLSVIKYFSVDNPIYTDKSLTGNIVIIIGALYQQGLSSCSHKIPERIILIFTLSLGIMIVAFYNSMIVTSLLQPPPKYISTPAQLLDSSFELVVQNHAYAINFFDRPTNPILKAVNKKVKKGPGLLNPAEGITLMQKSKHAFYAEESSVYSIIEKTFSNEKICQLQEIELERPTYLLLPMKRNSPLKEFFNHGLLLMRESGIIQEEYNRWHPHKPQCQGRLSIPSVELQSLLVAYLILISGVVISLLVFSVEVMYTKYKKKQNTTDKNLVKVSHRH